MPGRSLSVIVLCVVFFPAVLPWTVDLPEVRKQHFKSGENDKSIDGVDNSKLTENVNIEPHDIYRDKYANDYDYLGYREKKMPQDGIEQGNKYIEGLRESIDKYARTLDYCTKLNLTKDSEGPDPPDTTDRQPASDVPGAVREQCGRASRSREHVRRLADLAVFTTKQLQDLDYEARYREVDIEREKELLMKLAFFLDELAHHTGYTPHSTPAAESDAETTEAPITTTAEPALNLNFLQVPQDVRDRMIACLRTDSDAPAPDRCAFPLPLPPILRRLFNITDSPANDTAAGPTPDQSSAQQSAPPDTSSRQFSLTDDSDSDSPTARIVQKRSIDESPLENVLQYYLKYHTWLNSNLQPITNDKQTEKSDYSVPNDLKSSKSVIKRSVGKKLSYLRRDDDLVTPRKFGSPRELNDSEKKSQINKIKLYLDKIRNSDGAIAKKRAQRLEKTMKSRTVRSAHYENPILPKISQDPYQDISGYIKNKPGTNYQSNLIQAAQARAGLEQIFQNGNIEVVRRYGSNINPLVPFPFFAGILASVADI